MKNSKTISSKYISFALIVIITLSISSFVIYKLLIEDKPEVKKVAIENKIDGWDYTLDDRDTDLMKTEFENLENLLKSNEIDYQEYASNIAKLYVIDLYTLNNKLSSYDIPCLEYVLPSYKEDFKNKIMNTLYKSIVNNIDGKRKQELPEVSSVEIASIKEIESGYEVSIKWDYIKDLGYDKEANLTIIKSSNDKKIYVSKQVTGE